MESTEKNLYNNDVVVRLAAFALAVSLNYCMGLYFDEFPNSRHGFFIAPIINNIVFLWISIVCIKTAFSQDVKEILLLELFFVITVYTCWLLPKAPPIISIYDFLCSNFNLFHRVTYVIIATRLFWPCKNKDTGEYANWPVFGFIGLYFKITKNSQACAPASIKQATMAYAIIATSIFIGYALWKNGIKNASITAVIPIIFLVCFSAVKSKDLLMKRISEYHKKKAEDGRIKELARIAQEEKAEAEAKAARLAGECQGLQAAVTAAQKIIAQQMDVFAQAQDEQAKERARIAALEAVIARCHGAATDAGLLREILNPDNPHYSIRMVACVKMFEHFQGKRITGKSPKDAIAKYAMDNAEELGLLYKGEPSQNAADQCAFVLNWVNDGGVPRTQARPE